jgi:hypothetical protein
MKRSRSAVLIPLLATLALSGCGRDEPAMEPGAVSGAEEPAVDGLTPEEIRRQAEPMSPEQAEQLGIVDTTIHVEQLTTPEDTMLRPDTIAPRRAPEP